MDEILSTILNNTYSQAQLKHRLRVLKSELLKSFFGAGDKNQTPVPLDLNWLKSLPADFHQKFNRDNVYNIFSDIEEKCKSVPVLTLYLTFEPDETTLAQIGAFARKTFSAPSLLLDVKLNPSLVAGAAISWKGVLRDYSLRSKIEERKNEIAEGFKKFTR